MAWKVEGMADALLEAHREESAVRSYSKALDLLRDRKVNPRSGSQDKAEVIGQLNFSYQNQGLTFPHGLEAYIYVRRGEAHENLSTRHTESAEEHRLMAIADYGSAIALAPSYRAAQEGTARLLRSGKAVSK
jgi:hypothetical protein